MTVITVIVTYNRRQLLIQCVEAVRRNRPEKIIVVNNGSTDGTREWLDQQTDLHVIHQENVGGSGGFCRGMQEALCMGGDAIWCMDDDVRPHDDCLDHMRPYMDSFNAGIIAPRRIMDGKVFTNDFCRYNLYNPVASLYADRIRHKTVDHPIDIAGTAFEGLFVRRDVVEQIGLPNKDLLIFCDDTDFCLRAYLCGYRILYVPHALMDKENLSGKDTWAERQQKKKWKRFYQIRNSTYLNHHYGQNWTVRYLRGLITLSGYVLTVLATAPFSKGYSLCDIPRFWKAYTDGINERLGR